MSDITLVDSFGTRGTGNGQFEYPGGLVIAGGYIFVVDSQNNRIQQLSLNGLMIAEFGNGVLSFPHSICNDGDKLYITDSANHRIVVYTVTGLLVTQYGERGEYGGQFQYPTGAVIVGDYIYVVDSQNNRVQKLEKLTGKFISEITTDIDYPFGISTLNNQLYLTQPHEVRIYDLGETPIVDYSSKFMRITRQLLPTGRAWWLAANSYISNIFEALSVSDSRIENDIINIKYSILADSNFMSLEAVERWESIFAIKSSTVIEDRILAINQRQSYPGNVLARQSMPYIQSQLQLAGFNVYLSKGFDVSTAEYYDDCYYDDVIYDSTSDVFEIIANDVVVNRDAHFCLSSLDDYAIYTISASDIISNAQIQVERKNEFRELILRLKPAQVVCVLKVTYV
jgi:hypothetical protein